MHDKVICRDIIVREISRFNWVVNSAVEKKIDVTANAGLIFDSIISEPSLPAAAYCFYTIHKIYW